jgi:competence protein ComEC
MTSTAPATQRVDLRLVPSAMTGWVVTACGILWHVAGSTAGVVLCVGATVVAGWCGVRGSGGWDRAVATAAAAVAVAGAGFAVAVGVRVDELRDHPIAERYGTIASVVVTPSESPRALGGNRIMFRGTVQALDGHETNGRAIVFASAAEFALLTAGRPVGLRARISRPLRRDLTVAVLSASGRPVWGDAAPIHRAAHHIRAGFADAARRALPADQAAMLPALVLGDTSAVSDQTTAQFRASGLTHLSV